MHYLGRVKPREVSVNAWRNYNDGVGIVSAGIRSYVVITVLPRVECYDFTQWVIFSFNWVTS